MQTSRVPAISSNDFPLPDEAPRFCHSCRALLDHGLSTGSSLCISLQDGLSHGQVGRGLLDKDTRTGKTDRRAKLQFCPGGKGKRGGRRQGFVKTVAGPSGLRAHPYFKYQLDKQNKNQRGKQGARLSYQKGFQWYLPCPPVPLKFVAGGGRRDSSLSSRMAPCRSWRRPVCN